MRGHSASRQCSIGFRGDTPHPKKREQSIDFFPLFKERDGRGVSLGQGVYDLHTEIIKLDKNNIDMDKLRYAADVLKGGGLVAFPTETVYGLGANALETVAVKKIFAAKGRPSDNPLIVHISDKKEVKELSNSIPSKAFELMDRFWPGPLTLVLEKSELVPEIITAGLSTVAIRMPSHPVALALIRESGLPVAAPSANLSGKPSPTNARHVIADLSGRVDVIIDAGSAKVGLESTVVDLTVNPPMILRPGGVTPLQLKELLSEIVFDPSISENYTGNLKPRSPGMKYTHYSPKAEVVIIEGELTKVVSKINEMAGEYKSKGVNVGVLATEQTKGLYTQTEIISAGDRNYPETIAARLFSAFRDFDERNIQVIIAEAIDNTGIGVAIMNRMKKAAGYNIVKVD